MERTRTISETVILGALALDIDCDIDCKPKTVAIFGTTSGRLDVDKLKVQLTAEELERLARVIQMMRHERGDYRDACAEHGYHDGKGKYGQCAECHPADAPAVVNGVEPGEAA